MQESTFQLKAGTPQVRVSVGEVCLQRHVLICQPAGAEIAHAVHRSSSVLSTMHAKHSGNPKP